MTDLKQIKVDLEGKITDLSGNTIQGSAVGQPMAFRTLYLEQFPLKEVERDYFSKHKPEIANAYCLGNNQELKTNDHNDRTIWTEKVTTVQFYKV